MVSPSASDSPFEPAKPEETLPLLQSAVPRSSRLQCWTSGQKHSFSSRIVKVNETKGVISISVSKEDPGGEEFERALIRDGVEEVLFSLHLPTDIVFFKGAFRKGESGFFNVRIKLPIFKTQRRQAMRLPVSGVSAAFQVSGGVVIDAEVLNFSEGGIGISIREKKDFDALCSASSPIQASFTVHGIRVSAKLSVRHTAEFGTGIRKRYRVGMAFESIDPKLRERLSQVVLEESSKYLGRY